MAEPASPYAAFVSYAPLDWAKAKEICDMLEELGLPCLMAARRLRGGRGVAGELRSGIEQTRAFVLVVSKATEDSQPAREEMYVARQLHLPIFGIFVEPPEPSSEIDFFVPESCRINAWSGHLADHVPQLAGYLRGAMPRAIKRAKVLELTGWRRRAVGMPGILAALTLSGLILWALSRLLEGGLPW
ncbi:MAG: toll/interleukin-1 receptor domain-containing protein [Alphaproteobacteria bacterium]